MNGFPPGWPPAGLSNPGAEVAAQFGTVPRLVPAEQWGNPGSTGRAGTPIGWSQRKLIAGHVGTTRATPKFEPVLGFTSPGSHPLLYQVSVQLTAAPGNTDGVRRRDLSMRLRWTLGALASEAVVDVTAASSSFSLACDSLSVELSNPAAAVTVADLIVVVAASPTAQVAANRAPRRTEYLEDVTDPANKVVTIPMWAQQLQIVPQSDAGPGAWEFDIVDAGGIQLTRVYVDTTNSSYPLIELPSGADKVNVISFPASPKTFVGFVFVLGF